MTEEGLNRITQAALRALQQWYDSQRPSPKQEPERYVVCAGLAVIERMREVFPLKREDYVTSKSQVRTGGGLIRRILEKHGETRPYAREGGRTTRGTLTAAESIAPRINAVTELADLNIEERNRVADALQGWLADRVKDFFSRKKLEPEIALSKPGPLLIAEILQKAHERNVTGAVAQHLVGAKLALRYPKLKVENYSFTTADQQLGRSGDFVIGDTALHVTVAPMPGVFEKCEANIRNGFRSILLVRSAQVAAATSMAETLGLYEKVGILSIEAFVGQNIEEMSEFKKESFAKEIRQLLETYNKRISEVETDLSLMIEIPVNL